MAARITDDLADVRTRLGAATPGPWRVHPIDFGEVEVGAVTDLASGRKHIARVCECDSLADADLIANAPSDLRRLLDEVVRLRAEYGEAAPEGWVIDWDWDPDVDFAWLRRAGTLDAAVWPHRGAPVAFWRVMRDGVDDVAKGDAPSVIEAIAAAEAALRGVA